MSTLYELSAALRALRDPAEDDQEGWAKAIADLEGDVETKVENIAKLIRNVEADQQAIADEIKRLQGRAKSCLGEIDRYQKYILDNLDMAGMRQIKGSLFTIWVQNAAPGSDITDAAMLPANYWRVIPETQVPDKAAILEALKAGVEIPGARLIQGRTLRIR